MTNVTKERHHRSQEAGLRYVHGDSVFTLRVNIQHLARDIQQIQDYMEKIEHLTNAIKVRQQKVNRSLLILNEWIERAKS